MERNRDALDLENGDATITKNENDPVQNICKAERKLWLNGRAMRAFGMYKNEGSQNISNDSQHNQSRKSKHLVHNSGIIQRKLERLRFRGKNKIEPLELIRTVKPEKLTGEIASLDHIDLKFKNFSQEKSISLEDGDVGHTSDSFAFSDPPNLVDVQLDSQSSSDVFSSLSASSGKTSIDPPDVVAPAAAGRGDSDFWNEISNEYNFKGQTRVPSDEEKTHIPTSPKISQRSLNVSAWILASQKRRLNQGEGPFSLNHPYWASLEAEAEEELKEPVKKSSDIISWLSEANDFDLSISSDPVSCEEEIVEDPVPSMSSWTDLDSEISVVDSRRLNSDSVSIIKSGFSDSDDTENLSENIACFSFIRKRLLEWGRAIRGRFTRQSPGANSASSMNRESVIENESPEIGKKVRGKNNMDNLIIHPILTVSTERLNDLVQRGLLTVDEAQVISGDGDKRK